MVRKVKRWICEVFVNKIFFEGILLCYIVYMIGTLGWGNSRSILYLFGASTNFSSFTFLFPIGASISHALRFQERKRSHVELMVFQRCDAYCYIIEEGIKAIMSGFGVMLCGTLLFVFTLPLIFPNALLAYEINDGIIWPYIEYIARSEKWLQYFGVYAILLGISGTFFSISAMFIALITDEIYGIILIPILLLYILDYVMQVLGMYSLSTLMFGMYFFETLGELWKYAIGTFGVLDIVAFFLYVIRGRRIYVKN